MLLEESERDVSAVAWMCANVVIDAVSAVAIAVAVDLHGSMPVGAGLLAGVGLGCFVVGMVLGSGLLTTSAAWSSGTIWRQIHTRDGLLLFASRFDWVLFGFAVTFAGALTSATVLGLTTVMFVIFMDRLARDPCASLQTYRPVRGREIGFMLAAFGGMSMVIYSQENGWAPTGIASTIIGIALAAGAAVASALSATRFPLGHRMCQELRAASIGHPIRIRHEVGATSLAVGVTSSAASVLFFFAGLAAGGMSESGWWPGIALGALIGAALPTAGTAVRSVANLITRNLGVNAIAYFAPLLTILLFVAVGRSGAIVLWLAVSGGLVIAAANIALARPPKKAITDDRDRSSSVI